MPITQSNATTTTTYKKKKSNVKPKEPIAFRKCKYLTLSLESVYVHHGEHGLLLKKCLHAICCTKTLPKCVVGITVATGFITFVTICNGMIET